MSKLSAITYERLRHVSTATLCTQLFKRGFRNAYLQDVSRLTQTSSNLVGPAYTMRNIPAREDPDHLGIFESPHHPQRKAIETIPPGHVLVLDCRGDRRAAS
ncbi:MAG: ribonuclease activity regulator RraA, partial [Casimicrobiaceae bacterium]